jgi:hypothetical protein
MDEELSPNEFSLQEEFENLVKDSLPNHLITNFIVIAEVATGPHQELSLSISDSMTPWLAHGMLNTAMEMINSGEYQFPIGEEHNG